MSRQRIEGRLCRMTGRPKPAWIPGWVKTLDDLEEFAGRLGVDFAELFWAWGTPADVYRFARASGISAAELTERLLRAETSKAAS